MKILCLGNEFWSGDHLAKEVGKLLSKDYEVININDSFQLMTLLHEEESSIILDVVKNFKEVHEISPNDLKTNSILSAHDFDAAQVIKLIGKPVRIIGIPIFGDIKEIYEKVKNLLQ